MDTVLCDELLQEIFHRLPPPSYAVVSLVSKRWCRLLRSSITSLSLRFPSPYNPTTIASLPTFLSHHPFLSSISLAGDCDDCGDPLLLGVASSCPNLRQLLYLSSPVSPSSLYTLSTSCIHLSSIAITISRPLSFNWLPCFSSLKCLSLYFVDPLTEFDNLEVKEMKEVKEMEVAVFDLKFSLESLSLYGILAGDYGLGFLWRNCKNVKKLHLRNCESVGDYTSFSGFLKSLNDLQELELRTCSRIVDRVLLNLAENCVSLDSLLVYDGGSREGLLQFIKQSKCRLRRLELRLPLDLDKTHLTAIAENLNFRGLVSLRLESCCLVTGEGLKVVLRAIGNGLEELALINCDVVERESSLLAILGQDLKMLRKLDLSYNDMLLDEELVSVLISCNCLEELKLRGCSCLTNVALDSVVRRCKHLQSVDITCCCGIEVKGVELLVLNSQRLRQVKVEQSKISDVARKWASNKSIEVVSC